MQNEAPGLRTRVRNPQRRKVGLRGFRVSDRDPVFRPWATSCGTPFSALGGTRAGSTQEQRRGPSLATRRAKTRPASFSSGLTRMELSWSASPCPHLRPSPASLLVSLAPTPYRKDFAIDVFNLPKIIGGETKSDVHKAYEKESAASLPAVLQSRPCRGPLLRWVACACCLSRLVMASSSSFRIGRSLSLSFSPVPADAGKGAVGPLQEARRRLPAACCCLPCPHPPDQPAPSLSSLVRLVPSPAFCSRTTGPHACAPVRTALPLLPCTVCPPFAAPVYRSPSRRGRFTTGPLLPGTTPGYPGSVIQKHGKKADAARADDPVHEAASAARACVPATRSGFPVSECRVRLPALAGQKRAEGRSCTSADAALPLSSNVLCAPPPTAAFFLSGEVALQREYDGHVESFIQIAHLRNMQTNLEAKQRTARCDPPPAPLAP